MTTKNLRSMGVKKILVLALILRLGWLGFNHYRPPFTYEEGRQKHYSLTEYDHINIDAVEISKGRWPHREDKEVTISEICDVSFGLHNPKCKFYINHKSMKTYIKGEPLAWRPIGYPAFLGLLYFLFGANYWTLYGSTLILQLLTVWIIYLIGLEIFDERTALISAFLFAVYPISIYSTSLALDEHLFLPLFLGGLLLLIREIKK